MDLDINKFSLENGLDVFHCHMGTNDISLIYGIDAGSEKDKPENAGLAHMVEHLIFKGTPKRKNRDKIYAERSSIGTDLSCNTYLDKVELGMRVLVQDFDDALEFSNDILFNAIFNQEDIEKEKLVIMDEMRISRDKNPLYPKFYSLIFEGHPYGRPVLGYENTMNGLSQKIIKKFYLDNYVPSNMGLIVTGDISLDKLKDSLEKAFKNKNKSPIPLKKRFKMPKNQRREVLFGLGFQNSEIVSGRILEEEKITQASYFMNSILTRKIQKELLNKYATSYISQSFLNSNLLTLYASCKNGYHKFVRDILKNCMASVKSGEFEKQEIEDIIVQGNKTFVLNSNSSNYIARTIFNSWPKNLKNLNWLNEFAENRKTVAKEAIVTEARKHLNIEDLTTVVVGNI